MRFWLVIAALAVSALLIVVPAFVAPDAGDICNARSSEEKQEIKSAKNRRAASALFGAILALAAGIVALIDAAAGRRWRWAMALAGVVSLAASAGGVFVAVWMAAVIC